MVLSIILAATLALGVCASAATLTFANAGIASPYPSNISVLGFSGLITKVTVSLFSLTHTWPGDIDILLVGPAGQNILLMSDTGTSLNVTGINLVLTTLRQTFVPMPHKLLQEPSSPQTSALE